MTSLVLENREKYIAALQAGVWNRQCFEGRRDEHLVTRIIKMYIYIYIYISRESKRVEGKKRENLEKINRVVGLAFMV